MREYFVIGGCGQNQILSMIAAEALNQINTILRVSLSIDFVILIFLLGEYRSMAQDSTSPIKLRPIRNGILVVLTTVIITVAAISANIFSTIYGFNADIFIIASFTLQMVIIIGASIWLSHVILTK